LIAIGQRDLDGAEALFERAYAWHPKWPSLTLSMANVAMTDEAFDRAAGLYVETLTLEPRSADARIGLVRALTYLGRHEDAIAAADALLA
jgi:tetratricopeptide (TPR) repeat protein